MEDRRAVGVAAASLYNSYTYYFGPRKGNAMTKEHDDLYDRYNCEGDREYLSQCDCCAAMKYDCVDLVIMGMDTHACPECRNDIPENF